MRAESIAGAKQESDGSLVALNGAGVSAGFSSCFYAEDAKRVCGIRVDQDANGLTRG